ncbi:LamG-like jellyroll fold domain-containing protein [Halorubrum sp. CSM-61]|uniref:LamG-like jellyroll fold domain-containing protein n=1 Tax=Halorubrum sp. CSM-61 TaxID=2485838 RepID=UPI0013DE4460|nr:LamG-like jellyroll fold domain-containing protein [Halorubrum sp. CSM-61]
MRLNKQLTTDRECILAKKSRSGVADAQMQFGFFLSQVDGDFGEMPVFRYGDGSSVNTVTGNTIAPGPWYVFIIEFDSSTNTVTIYKNNIEVASASFSNPPVDRNDELVIGAHYNGSGTQQYPFNGDASTARVYNRILSTEERRAHTYWHGPAYTFFQFKFDFIIDDAGPDAPVAFYQPDETYPYKLIIHSDANTRNDLWLSDDLQSWTLDTTDLTGTKESSDGVYVDGTYYIYERDPNGGCQVFSGSTLTSPLTSHGNVLSGPDDVGAAYQDGYFYLFPENPTYDTGSSSQVIDIYRSSNPTSGFSKIGTAIDFEDRPMKIGDADIFKYEGTWYMAFDVTSDHPHYGTALAKSDDLLDWELITNSDIKDWKGGDLEILIADQNVGFTELTQGRDPSDDMFNGVSQWRMDEVVV